MVENIFIAIGVVFCVSLVFMFISEHHNRKKAEDEKFNGSQEFMKNDPNW